MLRFHSLSPGHVPFRAHLELAGKTCALATNDGLVLASMDRWLAKQTGPHDFEMNVVVDGSLQPSNAPATFRGMNHFVVASMGSDYFGFDLLRKKMFGVISRQTAANATFWNEVLLPIAVGIMGCSMGVIPMHCACLDWKGQGVLIAGQSGAGKSTLSAAMAQCGFAYVSDDWTYVSKSAGGPVAYGLGAPLKLLPDADRFFPTLRGFQPGRSMNGEMAYEVDSSVFARKTKMVTHPKRVLLLERVDKGLSEFRRVDSEIVRQFFQRSSERLPDTLKNARNVRSRTINAVGGLDCWRFIYSGSPHEAANAVRNLVEG